MIFGSARDLLYIKNTHISNLSRNRFQFIMKYHWAAYTLRSWVSIASRPFDVKLLGAFQRFQTLAHSPFWVKYLIKMHGYQTCASATSHKSANLSTPCNFHTISTIRYIGYFVFICSLKPFARSSHSVALCVLIAYSIVFYYKLTHCSRSHNI